MEKKCSDCRKKINYFLGYFNFKDGTFTCPSCLEIFDRDRDKQKKKEQRKKLEEIIVKAPKIKCPYCEKWFAKLTQEQYEDCAKLMFPWTFYNPWGVVGVLKNTPYIECPHCKIKVMKF